MSRLQQYQSNFTLGSIDPLLRGRVDLQQYYSGLETAKNVLIEPQGGFSRRAGLRFVREITSNFNGSVLLVPFTFSSEQTLLLCLTNDDRDINIEVYENGSKIVNLTHTIALTEIFSYNPAQLQTFQVSEFDYAQNADTIIFTHPFMPSFSLKRGASNLVWTVEKIDLTAPLSNFNATSYFPSGTITPDAEEGTIKITASNSIFHTGTDGMTTSEKTFQAKNVSGQVTLSTAMSSVNDIYNNNILKVIGSNGVFISEYTITNYDGTTKVATLDTTVIVGNIVGNPTTYEIESLEGQIIQSENGIGRARIVEVDSATVVKAVTETPFFEANTAIANEKYKLEIGFESSISQRRGYFKTCTFHEGRLFFGGTYSEPTTLFASKVGQAFNFKLDEGLDDDALKTTIQTDQLNEIVALKSGRDLQIFTTGGEFYLPQADLEPVTPSNIAIKQATRRGAKPNIKVQGAEGGTLFIQNKGKSIREMLYSDVELSYVANNISLLSSHLIIDPKRMALRPASDTTEGDLLIIVNGTDTAGYRSTSLEYSGSLACFMLNKSQNIVAPSHFTTDGDFLDVAIDGDDIYTVVKREPARNMSAQITFEGTSNGQGGYTWSVGAGATLTLKTHDGTVYTFITGTQAQFDANPHANNTYYIRHGSHTQAHSDFINIISQDIEAFSRTFSYVSVGGSVKDAIAVVTREDAGADNLEITQSGFGNALDITGIRTLGGNNALTNESKFARPIVYYLEVFDDDFTTDSAVQITSGFSGTTYTGFDHIAGETLDVIRDDVVETTQLSTDGSITVDSTPTTYLEAGLNYEIEVKTMPFETKLASGVVQSQKRRIVEVSPILFKTQNVEINGFDIPLSTLPISGTGAVPTFTGVKKTMGFRGYTRDAQITIKQTKPVFITVLSLDYKVSIGQ